MAPVITNPVDGTAFTFVEGTVITDILVFIDATDADADDTLTYSISAGNDDGLFVIDANDGELRFAVVPDYATSSHRSNDLSITVTDSSNTTTSITLIILVTSDALTPDEITWAEKLTMDTIIYYADDTTIQSGTLGSNLTLNIEGNVVTFKGGEVIYFHADESVRLGKLVSDTELTVAPHGAITFKGGSFIGFHADGSVGGGKLVSDTELTVATHGAITFEVGYDIVFHADGSVIQGYLAQNINLGGVDYTIYTWLRFYADNGEVAGSGFDPDWTGER